MMASCAFARRRKTASTKACCARRRTRYFARGQPARAQGQSWPFGHQDLGRQGRAPDHRRPLRRVRRPGRFSPRRPSRTRQLPDGDFICVVRFQGPKANGMPELHSLTPSLSSILDAGHKVALVSDGRMSGASGKVAAAIHLTPEAVDGGPIAKLKTGDRLRVDCVTGTPRLPRRCRRASLKDKSLNGPQRPMASGPGTFRRHMRRSVGPADAGGAVFW